MTAAPVWPRSATSAPASAAARACNKVRTEAAGPAEQSPKDWHLAFLQVVAGMPSEESWKAFKRQADDAPTDPWPVIAMGILAKPTSQYPVVLGDPAVAADGPLVVFAYRANDAVAAYLFVRVSRDAGLTWANPKMIARVITDRRIGEQSVAISSAGIFVAWTNRATGSIIVQRSTDQGATFHEAQRLGVTTATFDPDNPTFTDGLIGLAATGPDVDVAWSPSGNGQADSIVLSRSIDGGSSYLAAKTIMAKPSFGFPALSAAGAYLAGEIEGIDGAIIALSSRNAGTTVVSHRLAGPGEVSGLQNGGVAVDSLGHIVLTYSRTGSVSSVPSSVLIRRSADGGSHWAPFETVSSGPDPVQEIDPAFVAGGTLVVWTSCVNPDGTNCDMFESRGP